MKRIFVLLVMFLLMGMLTGIAMASNDTGPPGVAVLMLTMSDAHSDVSVTPAAAIVARTNKLSVLPALGLYEKGSSISPPILVGCNHENHPGTGHIGGVSMARGNTMANSLINDMICPAMA